MNLTFSWKPLKLCLLLTLWPTLTFGRPETFSKEFKVRNPKLGSGKYSLVSLVEHEASGNLYALKEKTGSQADTGDAYMKHANLHLLWRHLQLASTDLIYVENGKREDHVILHGYVEGKTLIQAQSAWNFFADKKHEAYQKLLDFVESLVKSHVYILDLNAKNIVYNKKTSNWEIIDSQRGRIVQSIQECFDLYEKIFTTRKWVGNSNNLPQHLVEGFFEYFAKKRMPALLALKSTPRAATVKLVSEIQGIANSSVLHPQVKVWQPAKMTFQAFLQGSSPSLAPPNENPTTNPKVLPDDTIEQRLSKFLHSLPPQTDHGDDYLSKNGQAVESFFAKNSTLKGLSEHAILMLPFAVSTRALTLKDLRRLLLIIFANAESLGLDSASLAKLFRANPSLTNIIIARSEMFLTSQRYHGKGGTMYRKIMRHLQPTDCEQVFEEK